MTDEATLKLLPQPPLSTQSYVTQTYSTGPLSAPQVAAAHAARIAGGATNVG
jgi:hypothetical protein